MGTRLTDAKFFGELIDCTLPGLEEIPALAAKEDYAACRRLFAVHVRQMLQPEVYLNSLNPNTKDVSQTSSSADEAVQNKVLVCEIPWDFGDGPIDWFFNPTYNGYPEWTWQLSRHMEWIIMARAYREIGDKKYAEATARQLRSWIDQAQAPEACDGHTTLCWRTIEAGIRMGQCWPEVLHTFYKSPAFDDDLLTDWCKSVWEHGERLSRDFTAANWLIMEMNGLGHIGILFPCFKAAKEWYTMAVEKMLEELGKQVYADGFQYELSSAYHNVVIRNYVDLMRTMKAYGKEIPAAYSRTLEDMMVLNVKIMRPNRCLPNINDGRLGPVTQSIGAFYDLFEGNETLRWVMTETKEGRAPEETSMVLPYAGMAALRTGWGEDDTWLFFDGGPFGKAHQHEDKLQVLFHAAGKYILTEGNIYAYDSSEMRKYVLSTRGHNSVLVDGNGQNRHASYRWEDGDISKTSGLQSRLGDTVDAVRAVYNEGYGEEQDKSITHERSVYFFKKEEGTKPFAVIVDRLTADKEHDYAVLWHLDTEKLAMNGLHVQAEELRLLAPEAPMETAGLAVERGVQHPDWQGWFANSGTQKDFRPVYAVQHRLHAKDIRWVTVLSQDDSITGVEASLDVNDTKFTLKKADGTALVFDEADLL